MKANCSNPASAGSDSATLNTHTAFSQFPMEGVRTATEGKILKAEGVVAGVSDLILLIPRNGKGALCIEMKTRTGVQRESQKIWQEECEKHGNQYVVVRSFDQFREVVTQYLGEGDGLDVQSARNQLSELLNKNV